jgi:hypothetical protein
VERESHGIHNHQSLLRKFSKLTTETAPEQEIRLMLEQQAPATQVTRSLELEVPQAQDFGKVVDEHLDADARPEGDASMIQRLEVTQKELLNLTDEAYKLKQRVFKKLAEEMRIAGFTSVTCLVRSRVGLVRFTAPTFLGRLQCDVSLEFAEL